MGHEIHMNERVLTVEDLRVELAVPAGRLRIVQGVCRSTSIVVRCSLLWECRAVARC